MARVEEVVGVRVEICVALHLLQAGRVGHHHDVEVTAHRDSGLQGRNGGQLADAVNEGDETHRQHHRQHAHQELTVALPQVV